MSFFQRFTDILKGGSAEIRLEKEFIVLIGKIGELFQRFLDYIHPCLQFITAELAAVGAISTPSSRPLESM